MSCDAPPDAFLEARLAGALDTELHWQAADMDCDGMRRPDGLGLRIRFQGTTAGEHLTLVFAAPRLAEGESAHAVPVNVTLIREGGSIYGTRGEERCLLDEVTQAPLPTPLAALPPNAVVDIEEGSMLLHPGAEMALDLRASNHAAAKVDPAVLSWCVQARDMGLHGVRGRWRA